MTTHLRKQIDLKRLGHIEEWTSNCGNDKGGRIDQIVSYNSSNLEEIDCKACLLFLEIDVENQIRRNEK